MGVSVPTFGHGEARPFPYRERNYSRDALAGQEGCMEGGGEEGYDDATYDLTKC